MWKKHRIVFQDHVKYIHNGIVKPFRVGIIQYVKRVHDIHNLSKYLPPPSMKGDILESDSWDILDKEWSESEIFVAIKNRLPITMQDELEDNQEDYNSIAHEEWCDLLLTIEVKGNRKKSVI